jgi:hypothetical protein
MYRILYNFKRAACKLGALTPNKSVNRTLHGRTGIFDVRNRNHLFQRPHWR